MYYYNLIPSEIHQIEKNYSFTLKEDVYYFLPSTRPLPEIKDISSIAVQLIERGVPIYEIIKNEQGQFYTDIQGESYILLKTKKMEKDNLCLGEVLSFQNLPIDLTNYKSLQRQKWDLLWSSKIDYFEYQVNQFGKKYPIIRESFSYFCGLAENAISYVHALPETNRLVLAHKRTGCRMCLWELYNPLTFIVDDPIRDAAEYFKDKYFYGYLTFAELEYYLLYCISEKDYARFYARLLYPSYYFDIYEDVIAGKKREAELLKIIHKTTGYENLLYDIFAFMNEKIYVPKPEWIQKNVEL